MKNKSCPLFVYAIPILMGLMHSAVFAQQINETQILDIANYKNTVTRDSLFTKLIKAKVYKSERDFYTKAEIAFNNFYLIKDTVSTLKLFNLLGTIWVNNKQLDSVLKVKQIQSLITKNTPLAQKAIFESVLAENLRHKGLTEQSRAKSKKSIGLFEQVQDSSYSAWANEHRRLVIDNAETNDFSTIIKHAFAGMALYRYQKNIPFLNKIKSALANCYSLNYLFEPAQVLRNEIILDSKATDNNRQLVFEYLNSSLDQKLQGKFNKQAYYLNYATAYADSTGNNFLKFISYNSYLVYACQQNLKTDIEKYYRLSEIAYNQLQHSAYDKLLYLDVQGYYQYSLGNYAKAEKLGLQKLKLAEAFDSKEIIMETHELLALIYNASNEKEKAIEQENFLLKYQNATKLDALKNQLIYYQTTFEIKNKDLKIVTQKNNIALLGAKNKLKKQWLIFGGLGLLCLFAFITVLRSRNFAKNKQKLQEAFTQDIINTQEEERTRVSLELHDGVGQQLMLLTRKSKELTDPSLEILAKETLENLRSISQGLYPILLERFGFTAGIQDLIDTLDENSDLFFTSDIENIDEQINVNIALHLYRICQEVLQNIIKHAEAKSVEISVSKTADQIILQIKDNGKGFNYQQKLLTSKSLGMKSILERCKIINAKLDIKSAPNKGTAVKVILKQLNSNKKS